MGIDCIGSHFFLLPLCPFMEKLWYAMGCTSPRKELKVRDDARRQGFQSFVPLKYEVRRHRGQQVCSLVPAISGLVFICGTLDEVKQYAQTSPVQTFIRKSTFSDKKDYLTVSLSAMENFISVTENNEERITYFNPSEIHLREGDQIRVRGGLYDGCEGIIMRIKGKRNRHLVVQIPGVIYAAVEMSPDMIELKGQKSPQKGGEELREKPSKNIDKDKRLLFDLAHRLLFEIPDRYQNESEYFLLLSELRRTRQRLLTFRGYTPATEAELALPLYMAAVQLKEAEPVALARLQKAIAALKPISLLRLKCQLFVAVLNHDAALLTTVKSTISSWPKPYSQHQHALIDELGLLVNQ